MTLLTNTEGIAWVKALTAVRDRDRARYARNVASLEREVLANADVAYALWLEKGLRSMMGKLQRVLELCRAMLNGEYELLDEEEEAHPDKQPSPD